MTSTTTPPAGGAPAGGTALQLPARAGRHIGEYVFAALAIGLGIFTFIGALSIRVPASGVQVGPRVFPYFVGTILIVSAAMVLISVIRGRFAEVEEGEDVDSGATTDWPTLAKIVALVVAHIILIDLLGWPIAAAVLFGGVAWTLGAKKWWLALLIGLTLGLVVFIAFGGFLGLSLPSGPLLSFLDPILRMLRG